MRKFDYATAQYIHSQTDTPLIKMFVPRKNTQFIKMFIPQCKYATDKKVSF